MAIRSAIELTAEGVQLNVALTQCAVGEQQFRHGT